MLGRAKGTRNRYCYSKEFEFHYLGRYKEAEFLPAQRHHKAHSEYTFFYKNTLYKNIEAKNGATIKNNVSTRPASNWLKILDLDLDLDQ